MGYLQTIYKNWSFLEKYPQFESLIYSGEDIPQRDQVFKHVKSLTIEKYIGQWNITKENPSEWSQEALHSFKTKHQDLYDIGFQMSTKYRILFRDIQFLSLCTEFCDETYFNFTHLECLREFEVKAQHSHINYAQNQDRLKQMITSLMLSENGLDKLKIWFNRLSGSELQKQQASPIKKSIHEVEAQ